VHHGETGGKLSLIQMSACTASENSFAFMMRRLRYHRPKILEVKVILIVFYIFVCRLKWRHDNMTVAFCGFVKAQIHAIKIRHFGYLRQRMTCCCPSQNVEQNAYKYGKATGKKKN
jgi:hypothetical protein